MLASGRLPQDDASPSPPDRLFAAQVLREEAKRAGFVRFGIARAEEPPRHALFADWLAAGRHAGMRYLEGTRDVRSDPRTLLPGARSVVCLAAPYAATPWIAEDGSHFARYSRGSDYHGGLRAQALAVVAAARARLGDAWGARVCVDSTPLAERSFAAAAGLGWIGKNGCLIDPEHGSYLLLAEILTDLNLPADAPVAEACGTCTRCLDACPTGAFVEPGLLDAGRCIAYWTIEHRGPIPDAWKAAIGPHVFGCDVCQEVCPFNTGAGPTSDEIDPLLRPRSVEHALPDLAALANKGANQLRQLVKRTALRRVPRDALLRNVAVALGNTGDPRAIPPLVALLGHRTALVRGHAAWALGELGAGDVLAAHSDRDPFVVAELTEARRTAATPRTPPPPRSAHR